MKSREEYESSIFAKRDALIAKRKKNIRMTVSALSVVLCLGAAAVAIPNLIEKAETSNASSATQSAGGTTEDKISAETETEIGTYPAIYDTGIAFTNQNDFGVYHNDFCIETVEGESGKTDVTNAASTEIYAVPDGEIAVEEGEKKEETTKKVTTTAVQGYNEQFANGLGNFRPESPDDAFDSSTETSSKKNFTTEEIVAQAKKYVADADKIIDDKTNVTVSRTSNGTTSYTAYFYTADKKITVELDSNLTAREIKEKELDSDVVQITPGYNPNA